MTFEENHIKAQDAYLRQNCDATAEATVGRMFEAIGYRPGMVIVPADRIEKLEAALIDILKVPRSEASWGIALVIAHHALKEGKDE